MTLINAPQIWEAALGEIQIQVSRSSYRTWFQKTTGLSYQGNHFVVGVPNTFVAEYLERDQRSLIEKALIGFTSAEIQIDFRVNGKQHDSPNAPVTGKIARQEAYSHHFNPRYVFDNFIEGSGNRLARTAALAVAREPVVAPPAVGADGTLYVGSWDGFVYAIRDGAVQWNAPVDGQVYGACAVGPGGEVLVGTRAGRVYALTSAGGPIWDRKLGDGVYGTPAIAEGGVCFVGCNDNRLYALDLTSGEVAWRERVGRDIRSSVALTDDGTILAASWDWSLYAFEGGAGGPADAPWPQFHRDAARTGRAPGAEAEAESETESESE